MTACIKKKNLKKKARQVCRYLKKVRTFASKGHKQDDEEESKEGVHFVLDSCDALI